MIFGASFIYLALTLLVLLAARWRGGVSFDCAVALLVWDAMVNATYRYNTIETAPTLVICVIFIAMCAWLVWRWDQHWVTLWLLVSAFGMLFWNALEQTDAYYYKAVKNGIYAAMLLAVAGSIWTTSPRVTAP